MIDKVLAHCAFFITNVATMCLSSERNRELKGTNIG